LDQWQVSAKARPAYCRVEKGNSRSSEGYLISGGKCDEVLRDSTKSRGITTLPEVMLESGE
jgi:hypothetical protein